MGHFSFSWGQPTKIERNRNGSFEYTVLGGDSAGCYLNEEQKLKAVLSNPAALKAISLNCDLFSLGNINLFNKSGDLEKENFLYDLREKPNFKQNWTQFLWDYKFWLQMGTAYLWNPGNAKLISDSNTIQWLNAANIEWDSSLLDKLRGLIFSKVTFNEIMKGTVKYKLGNGQVKLIPLSEITPFFDLSNGVNIDGNFYKGSSRIDALYKVIANSEASLDAKNINLKYSGKFLVSGQSDPGNMNDLPMMPGEQQSIEQRMNGSKSVYAVKSLVDIKRFVDNMKSLALDESYTNDFLVIGSMLNIPKEVLDANIKGSTFENQDKGMLRLIEFGMKPSGQMLTDHFESQYGFTDVRMGWEHLSCNQAAELERANKNKVQLENINLAVTMQAITPQEAKVMIDKILS